MAPTEAKFDGERGFLVDSGFGIFRVNLLRSKCKTPQQTHDRNFND